MTTQQTEKEFDYDLSQKQKDVLEKMQFNREYSEGSLKPSMVSVNCLIRKGLIEKYINKYGITVFKKVKGDKVELKNLIKNLIDASISMSWIGSHHPDTHEDTKKEYLLASNELRDFIDGAPSSDSIENEM